MPTVKPMRYAHSDGFTDVCFDKEGKYILTCGSDGDVRFWDGIDDDDALSFKCGDNAFAVAIYGNRYFTATESNTIQAYTFPDGTPDGVLTRFTAPASHIILNKSGSALIAGATDFTIKVVNMSDLSFKSCQGHEGPVLGVALDPQEEYLASSSCDGTIKVWKMSDKSQVHSMKLVPKCSDISLSKTMCRMCWEPKDGKLLYVPCNKEIQVYKRDSWERLDTITDPCFTEHVSVLAISPDGKYLAAGGYDGWLAIFNLKSRKLVDKHRNGKGLAITSLAWNPKGSLELVFCDNQGQLGQLTDISTTELEQQTKAVEEAENEDKIADGIFDDDDDDFLVQATNDGNISEDDGVRVAKPTQALLSDDDSMPDFPIKEGGDNDNDDASSVTSDRSEPPKPEPVRVEGYKPTPLQRGFQPGSTPEHLSSRFMVWNAVGIIRQYNNEDENSIDIEFHDTSIHHAMHIINNLNYTMADLSTEAALLATEGDSDSPSKLTCMHFSSWDNTKEWSVSMPAGEEVVCASLGEGWLAAGTDARNIRLYTVAGVQKEVLTVPGPLVCLCAHTSQLMVVYHRGVGLPGEQCLGVTVLDVRDWRREVQNEPLPLSAKSTLNWAGFSAEGTPFYLDSEGVLRMLARQTARNWLQIADLRTHAKGKSDHHWIVSVHENPQQIRCIPCKGSRYPATLPRPAPVILPFQVPLCELNTEKAQYEEALWRTRLLTQHFDQWEKQGFEVDETAKSDVRKPAQENLMKLFALSARSEREFRALEVCEMIPDQHTLQLAIKYASRMRYMQLATRISEMAVRKVEEEEAKCTQTYDDWDQPPAGQASGFSRVRDYGDVEGEQDQAPVDIVTMETEEEDGEEQASGPLLATKVREEKQEKSVNPFKSRSNPFKLSSTPTQCSGSTKGTQVFDSMSKKKEKPALFGLDMKSPKAVQKKGGSQPKLFMKKKQESAKQAKSDSAPVSDKPATPFDLWLRENSDSLHSERPDIDEEEFSKYAAEQFRALGKEERQEWLRKSKELNQKSKENAVNQDVDKTDNIENKKRKRDDEDEDASVKKLRDIDETDIKKKPLGQTTNAKLANFAFKKDES